jgi:neutral amino acid transport system permease protein
MVSFGDLVSPLMNGFLVGSLYALLGLALTLSINATKMYNWAHGELATVGAYVIAVLTTFEGMSPLEGIVLAILASAGLALLVDESAFKPLIRRGAGSIQMMLVSIAISLFIRYGIFIYAAAAFILTLKANITTTTLATFLGQQISSLYSWIIPSTLATVVGLRIFLSNTMIGKQIRAMSDNSELARVSGIDVTMLRRYVWLMVGAVAGLAGAFWAMYSFITPEIGYNLLLDAFAAAIVGGLSYYGTVIAAYILGLAENLGAYVLNQTLGVPTQYKLLITFSIMIAVLILRPSGLTSRGSREL